MSQRRSNRDQPIAPLQPARKRAVHSGNREAAPKPDAAGKPAGSSVGEAAAEAPIQRYFIPTSRLTPST